MAKPRPGSAGFHHQPVSGVSAMESIDPSAANGGLVGPVAVADLRPEIRSALDSLRAGDISGVVRLPTGFAVLKRVPDAEAGAGALFPASGATSPMASAFTSALGSTGSVKYVYDLSGYVETVLSLRQVALPPDARDDLAIRNGRDGEIREAGVVGADPRHGRVGVCKRRGTDGPD